MSDKFLNTEEIAFLTGVKTGRNGKRREELQAAQLRKMGLPFFLNARQAPIVTWAAVNGEKQSAPIKQDWIPAVLKK